MKALSKKLTSIKHSQRGIMLLEGLIAILIFSLGILALVGMQATTLNHTSQTKYRLDAAFLANKLIGRMWADTNANMAQYQNGGAQFVSWFTPELNAYLPPGRSNATVTVTPFAATPALNATGATVAVTGYTVNINLQWRAPNELDTLPAHSYRVVTTVVRNP
jgi:type IV pilus assembly protein PilV